VKRKSRLAQNGETAAPEKEGFFARIYQMLKQVKEVLAAIAVIGSAALYLYNHFAHTTTRFSVMGADGNAIILKVSSSGPTSGTATLSGYQLKFGDLPIEDATLELIKGDEGKAVVAPGRAQFLHLTVSGLRGRCRTPQMNGLPDRYSKKEIESQVSTSVLKLTISIRESNHKDYAVPQPFSAATIAPFILQHLPEHIPEKSCP
jgi:hypothetical protein